MAVDGNAHERWEGRTASYDGGTWTYTREWLVQTTSATDRESVVSGATGLPSYGEPHPSPIAQAAYAKTIDYKQKSETPLGWIVSVKYTSERGKSEDNDNDATNDEVLVSFASELYQQEIFADVYGNALLNSAGDYLIDPTPSREQSHLIATIKANLISIPAWSVNLLNTVNIDDITIGGLSVAAGKAKLQRITVGERQYRETQAFYPFTIEIHINADGFLYEPMDAGFREKEGETSEFPSKPSARQQAKNDGDDLEPNTPILLDGNGKALADPNPQNAVFLQFQIYPFENFTVLPGVS